MKIGKVDIDREKKVSTKYKASSVPRYLLFKDGKLVHQKKGYVNMIEMAAIIDGLI
jgi:thioredoxin-like negative regulator of GroEL